MRSPNAPSAKEKDFSALTLQFALQQKRSGRTRISYFDDHVCGSP